MTNKFKGFLFLLPLLLLLSSIISYGQESSSSSDYLILSEDKTNKFFQFASRDGVLLIWQDTISVIVNTTETNHARVTVNTNNTVFTFTGTFNIYPDGFMIIDSVSYNNLFVAFNTGYFSITWERFIYDSFADVQKIKSTKNNIISQEGLTLVTNTACKKLKINYELYSIEYDIKDIFKRKNQILYKLYQGDMYVIVENNIFKIYNGSQLENE